MYDIKLCQIAGWLLTQLRLNNVLYENTFDKIRKYTLFLNIFVNLYSMS